MLPHPKSGEPGYGSFFIPFVCQYFKLTTLALTPFRNEIIQSG